MPQMYRWLAKPRGSGVLEVADAREGVVNQQWRQICLIACCLGSSRWCYWLGSCCSLMKCALIGIVFWFLIVWMRMRYDNIVWGVEAEYGRAPTNIRVTNKWATSEPDQWLGPERHWWVTVRADGHTLGWYGHPNVQIGFQINGHCLPIFQYGHQ